MLTTSAIKRINTRAFEISTLEFVVSCADCSSVCPVGSTPAAMNSHQSKHLMKRELQIVPEQRKQMHLLLHGIRIIYQKQTWLFRCWFLEPGRRNR
ncbi:MAG: succinate dehydogenase [Circular genetic element sp.]|nr:MAG: succinate dehydogenase [Circular genetic element sp.]